MTSSPDGLRGNAAGISFAGSAPSPDEAAAAIAGIERFIADTTPPSRPAPRVNPWQQAALIEGVSAKRSAFPADPGSGFPLSVG